MKKIILLFLALVLCSNIFSQESENYILIIDNDSIKINLNTEYSHKINSGKNLTVQIIQPKILTYQDEMISFNYDKSLNVSTTKIDEGIEQCMLMNAMGNGIIIQKYSTMNPTDLTDFMLSEITKESISYGYTKEEEPFEKKLADGKTIIGKKATLNYKGEDEVYTVAAYGAKDEGIIVLTMMLSTDFESKSMIDLFWNSLKIEN